MSILIKLLALAAGAVAGVFAFFYGSIVLFCILLGGGNQCGLPAIFFGAPLGAVVGAVAGWIMAGRMLRAWRA